MCQQKERNKPSAAIDESLMYPLAVNYEPLFVWTYTADIHDALASLRRLDGNTPSHEKYGAPVNLFRSSTHFQVLCKSEYSYALVNALYTWFSLCLLCWLFVFWRFFLFHVLDKVVCRSLCPFLVKYFDMWYGTRVTRLMENLLTCLWWLNWICKDYLFRAWVDFVVRASRSSTGEFVKKGYLLNKNIVHLIETFSGICHSKPPVSESNSDCCWQDNYVYYVNHIPYANYA